MPTKEELLFAPVRHGGTAIVNLLEQRPAKESPDVALINAIITRTRSFDAADAEEWREALLVAPDVLGKLTMVTAADRVRATKLIAARMGANPDADIRPGLLVQLAFAAGDFGFQRWVRQSSPAAAGSVCHRGPGGGQGPVLENGVDAVNDKYKVAVWATGGVGKYAIRTIADRPNLDLVGVWVHSDNKDGKDAGELAGMDPVGVRATRDASQILGGDADCVVYAAPAPSRMKEAIGDLCRILAAGKNIVTTAIPGLVYPRGSMPDKVIDTIRTATKAGGKPRRSPPGIEPGFGADLFPIALMSMCHRFDSVRGIEITNYSEYPAEYDMRELFGFGQPLDYEGGLKMAGTLRWGWGAAVTMVAESLGVELEDIRETCEFQATPRDITTAFGLVEAGTVGATGGALHRRRRRGRRHHDRARRPPRR